jgi:hypothetical protein
MVINRAQKHSAGDSSNPLQQIGILQHVLDYVGPGHWCLVAEVSSLWRDTYRRIASTEVQAYVYADKIKCVLQMTLFSAVFASPLLVRHAQAHELDCTTERYQRAAGRHADIVTLEAAHGLGMPYTYETMLGAARCNELAVVQFLDAQGCPWDKSVFNQAATQGHTAMCAYLHGEHCPWNTDTCAYAAINGHASTLRWLHEHGCPWNSSGIGISAAVGGSVDTIVYLQQQGIEFTAGKLTDMLNAAGAYNKLAAAKWLRQQEAEWPAKLDWFNTQWSGETLAWARAEGCTSPTE